jgi:hypothetical protein
MIPTRHPSWEEFASRASGNMKRNRFWRSDEVVTTMGGWEVHLQSVMLDHKTGARNPGTFYSSRRGTEVWAGFTSLDGFRFSARDREWLHKQPYHLQWDIDIGRLVDAVRRRRQPEDTQIGNEIFDQRFVTRTNDPGKLRALLDGAALERILKRPYLAEFHIEAGEPDESGSSLPASLVVWERQMIQNADQLLDLHEVLLALLDRLGRLGSAGPLAQT